VTEHTPSGALTVEEIRRLHLPVAGRPLEGVPAARAMITRTVHLETLDGKLACRVKREPDSLVTTDPRETTCPFCRGKKR
jgi:hypothetical protein